MSGGNSKLGFQATWSMAVGGMVGGGIFSTLGVVISIAGQWAWLSFVAAGLVALASGYSYSKLAEKYGEGGGAFSLTFLFTFATVNFLAWKEKAGHRILTAAGGLLASAATVTLIVRLARNNPWSLAALTATTLVAEFLRPKLFRAG